MDIVKKHTYCWRTALCSRVPQSATKDRASVRSYSTPAWQAIREVLTDPSYYSQVVTATYPLVGNYGINFDDYESRKSWVSGFIMRGCCEYPSTGAAR